MRFRKRGISVLAASLVFAATTQAIPIYQIYNIGTVLPNDTASQGFRISSQGLATGRSFRSGATQAYSWSKNGGTVGLPSLASPARAFSVGNGINDFGTVVGTGSTTTFGSSPLPLIWKNGVVSQLALPAGQTLGRANDVNDFDLAVGSVNGGSLERASYYFGGTGTQITATTAQGYFMTTAYGVNNSSVIAGQGLDPNNAAINVGLVYDVNTGVLQSIGVLPGMTSTIAFDISNGGHVVGSSSQNGANGMPFLWTAGGGMTAIPLPVGTTQGSARGVNASGWTVGTASSAFAIPFLWDGNQTYRIQDLLPANSGWDLATNTSSSALGISDNGYIVGTGVFNGQVRGYVLVPVPEPATMTALGLGVLALARKRRRN